MTVELGPEWELARALEQLESAREIAARRSRHIEALHGVIRRGIEAGIIVGMEHELRLSVVAHAIEHSTPIDVRLRSGGRLSGIPYGTVDRDTGSVNFALDGQRIYLSASGPPVAPCQGDVVYAVPSKAPAITIPAG